MSHRQERPDHRIGQQGISTFGLVAILLVICIAAMGLFLLSASGNKSDGTTDKTGSDSTATDGSDNANASSEPAFIRIPENSLIYKDPTYKFSFAYPSSFEKLSESPSDVVETGGYVAGVQSSQVVAKPVGNTGAVLSGLLGAFVYKKDDFKLYVGEPDIYASPTKTGDDTTWKIVSRGNTTQDINIGDAYPVKTITSQTGVKVFDIGLNRSTTLFGRYIFEAGDYYVRISLPTVSLPSGAALTDANKAAYNIIGANIASTIRVQAGSSSDTSTSADTGTTDAAKD